jgi:hypothetical protein
LLCGQTRGLTLSSQNRRVRALSEAETCRRKPIRFEAKIEKSDTDLARYVAVPRGTAANYRLADNKREEY